jgi:hypothetical protein
VVVLIYWADSDKGGIIPSVGIAYGDVAVLGLVLILAFSFSKKKNYYLEIIIYIILLQTATTSKRTVGVGAIENRCNRVHRRIRVGL